MLTRSQGQLTVLAGPCQPEGRPAEPHQPHLQSVHNAEGGSHCTAVVGALVPDGLQHAEHAHHHDQSQLQVMIGCMPIAQLLVPCILALQPHLHRHMAVVTAKPVKGQLVDKLSSSQRDGSTSRSVP